MKVNELEGWAQIAINRSRQENIKNEGVVCKGNARTTTV